MNNELNIKEKTINLLNEAEQQVQEQFKNQEEICLYNSIKVLNAFKKHNISEIHFNQTTGYGYNDLGREKIEQVYSEIFKSEDSLVRNQFISGTHALATTLFALLRPNDTLLSITGLPYDTLHEVIGIKENKSSLKSYGINYEQIDLVDNDFNYELIKETLKNKTIKVVEIQRSKGYSTRKSITLDKLEKVINTIRKIDQNVIIMVDNCYCEFVNKKEPIELGADITVGSLIKNLGAGITTNGAYVTGRKDLIQLVAERLNVPGQGKEVGPTQNSNKAILQGLYLAPNVVKNSIKTAILTAKALENLGYKTEPKYNEQRADIVQNIIFGNSEKVIKYTQGIQMGSAIDSNAIPTPWDMPGYEDQIIMASGSFVQGSSIEISCDAPIREPYIAYQQGSLTYEYGKIAVAKAIDNIEQ